MPTRLHIFILDTHTHKGIIIQMPDVSVDLCAEDW